MGRPYGGLGILWKKSLATNASFCSVPGTNRACDLQLNICGKSMMLINAYMPVDNHRKHLIDSVFQDTLDNLELFTESCSSHDVIIGGDLNLDMSRQNAHDICYRDFLDRHNMTYTFDLPTADSGYTYYDMDNGGQSCIDHFSVCQELCDAFRSVTRCEHALNPSKHLPVLIKISFPQVLDTNESHENDDNGDVMPISWCKVTDEHVRKYQHAQHRFLCQLKKFEVINCDDVLCECEAHKQQIDGLCAALIECCLKSDHVFPRVKKKQCRPNWCEDVKPYRDDAIWWHNLWVQHGRPPMGIVFDNMKESKRQYAYANRRNKRRENIKRKERMAVAISQNHSRNFFKEIKKLNPKVRTPPTIDGKAEHQEIASVFMDKYQDLYNSVPVDPEVMQAVSSHISSNIVDYEESDRNVSKDDVTKALKHLKARKSDGNQGFMSDHVILSCDLFKDYVSQLITSIITHGYQPRDILLGTIVSIPKDNRGNMCQSTNYRGITLCNALSKVIDIILLQKYVGIFSTSDMQYSFKRQHSTAMCSLVLKEVINYYLNNNSEVYGCFIDASKAFDRVRHDKLFEVLKDRGLPPIIIRMMLDLYQRQNVRTVWQKEFSSCFKTMNSIRQGGVISPVLYCVYVDVLLNALEDDGVGCRIGQHFLGAVGYADDLTLCAPSVSGLRRMLHTCEKFGEQFSVKYNPTKTVCVLFSRGNNMYEPAVYLSGSRLSWVKEVKHLGNYLNSNLTEDKDVRIKKGDLIQRVNSVLVSLGCSDVNILRKIFNTQCAHFYGTEAWNFSDRSVPSFQSAWNRCVRRLLRLPYKTHRRFLPQLIGGPTALDSIYSRFVKMTNKMKTSDNQRISFLTKLCLQDQRSIMGSNIHVISIHLNVSDNIVLQKYTVLKRLNDDDCDMTSVILELIDFRNGACKIDGFTLDECDFMMNFICTM